MRDIYINNELRSTTHVNNLHKKLMANKFLLSANTNLLDTTSLHSIYCTHVYSHLSYGLLVQGSMASKKAIKDLTSIQDSCVCLLSQCGTNFNAIPLCRKHHLIQLPDMIKMELAKYGYRLTYKDCPTSLQSIANAKGSIKLHHYPTRSRNTPNICRATTRPPRPSSTAECLRLIARLREEQASAASWEPRPPFEVAEMD